jgi:glycosyltransferase involved in cell wall biosynthesis
MMDHWEAMKGHFEMDDSTSPVQWLGYQSDPDAFYRDIDVLLLPSADEPFGRALIEAMAYGVPCIATNGGGVPEIITPGQDGWLYPVADVERLSQLMREAITDPNRRLGLGQGARRTVMERFTIEHQIKALLACYQDVLRSRG